MQKTIESFPRLFVVDTPPYIHKGRTIQTMMRDTLIALAPAALLACIAFGLTAFRVMALAMATAVFVEAFCLGIQKRDMRVYDGTALVTGLLFAFLLPAGAPWWFVIIGTAITLILGKHVFGGLGANPLCPPLVGWAIMALSWPTQMDATAMNLNSNLVDPLHLLKYFGVNSLPEGIEQSLLFGQQLGGLGSVHILALFLGGCFLILRGVIRWEMPLAFLISVYATGYLYWYIDPALYIAPHLYLLTGFTVFAAFFLATDHASTPVLSGGLILFGCLAGVLSVIIRIYGVYPDGVPFAILLANLFTPLIDTIRPRPWGKGNHHA